MRPSGEMASFFESERSVEAIEFSRSIKSFGSVESVFYRVPSHGEV
jgi:hypothetical protein